MWEWVQNFDQKKCGEQAAGRCTDGKIILKCIFKKKYVDLIHVLTIGYSDGLL